MRVLFTLIVVCFLWFISIGIIFAQSPPSFQFQAACSGPANGSWNYSAKEKGSCTCPDSFPLPSFDPGYFIDVCQNGNSLSGSTSVAGFSTKLKGTVSGQQVNFTITSTFSDNSSGLKINETLTDTAKGPLQGDTISGNVSSNWKFTASGQGVNITCNCKLNGTFKVNVNGGGPGPGPGPGDNDPNAEDVSQISGIVNQVVETTGVQWTDINKDGKLDLFMVGQNVSALFKNDGSGHFSQITSQILSIALLGAVWADFDNDGDLDVVIFNTLGEAVFITNTNGNFIVTSKASLNTGPTLGGIWLDFNNDGKVDVYVIKDGAPNQLFKNQGKGIFVDVATAAHVNVSGPARSAVAADFNGDGFADLYIVNFRAKNKLLINNGNGTFRAASGAPFVGASVQAIVGDYNNDQRFDILVVNNGGPSALFKNTGNDGSGNPKFVKVNAGISGATHGSAASFADFNNDGLLDLVLVQSVGGNILFRNKGDGTFSSVGTVNLNNPRNPTSLTTGDFNNDGLVDIMIGDGDDTQTNGDTLYKNNSNKNHWLEIALQGTTSNRSAITAVAFVRKGGSFQGRIVSGGNGQNQDSLVLHFGLGANTNVDEIEILWPGGVPQRCLNIKADRIIRVTEGSPSSLGCQ
ncbi:CRTAC1 family protein [bacterium]|nr:CRTAC1 family protein [bacterium]MCI0615389.1 CRTAC1 family protein [bacterium]